MTGTLKLSTSKCSGIEPMPLLTKNSITHTQYKETILPATKVKKLTHMLWMSTPFTLKNLPKKNEKNASRKDAASNAENMDTT